MAEGAKADLEPRGAGDLYLDLLKKALIFTLWKEPPIPITTLNYQRQAFARTLVTGVARISTPWGLELVQDLEIREDARRDGRF